MKTSPTNNPIPEINTKPKVAFYGITGCAGCLLSVIFNEDELMGLIDIINLQAFPFIKEVNIEGKYDYVFIEGLVASNEDLAEIKKLRDNSTYVVSLGACACTGCVPAYRQYTLKENYEHLIYKKIDDITDVQPTPIDTHIRVDYYIPGCPPSKKEISAFLKSIVMGKKPTTYDSPICIECRRNGNECLLDKGKPCLGPITAGGCNAVCINGGFECWGCRGSTKDMNLRLMIKILREKGFDDKFIEDRLRTFAGLKLPMLEDVVNYLKHPETHTEKSAG